MAAVWMIVNCRNGVSSCEIARTIGCKQQSAWHLLHSVRHILQQDRAGQFAGAVETDTTFVGGALKFMSFERAQRAKASGCPHGKAVVNAIKERRTGKVRASVVPEPAAGFVLRELIENVERGAPVYTDAAKTYRGLSGRSFQHDTVNHSAFEYVRGAVHTNACENFFNCLRRALKGTYIRATPEHLAAYVDEATFRFNIRELSEWERFDHAMRLIVGKRLTYSELTDGATR